MTRDNNFSRNFAIFRGAFIQFHDKVKTNKVVWSKNIGQRAAPSNRGCMQAELYGYTARRLRNMNVRKVEKFKGNFYKEGL